MGSAPRFTTTAAQISQTVVPQLNRVGFGISFTSGTGSRLLLWVSYLGASPPKHSLTCLTQRERAKPGLEGLDRR